MLVARPWGLTGPGRALLPPRTCTRGHRAEATLHKSRSCSSLHLGLASRFVEGGRDPLVNERVPRRLRFVLDRLDLGSLASSILICVCALLFLSYSSRSNTVDTLLGFCLFMKFVCFAFMKTSALT